MTLGDLFCAKKQLLVYHFMFGPGWGDGCPNCSFWADHFDSVNLHIGQRDTAFAVVSRAPWKEIAPFKKRMGWRFKWVSSFNTDFNLDFNVSFVEELAADIFMDDFSPKFTKAAKQAATVIEGTLYSRYYDVDCATLLSLPEAKPEPTRRSWFGRNREKPANPFAALITTESGN